MSEYITTLPSFAILSLAGEERQKYLQGQITNDLTLLDQHHAMAACHCDFKGKSWSNFVVIDWQQQLHVIGLQSGLSASLPELNKYAVFAKTNISQNSDIKILGGKGAEMRRLLHTLFDQVPAQPLEIVQNEMGVAIGWYGQRWLLLMDSRQPMTSKIMIDETHSQQWLSDDIQAGWPWISAATSNQFVPQMLNMQALDGINFKKGCYMGQEVVARTKYLGNNKRAAFILKAEQPLELQPGDILEQAVGENWRRGGTVINAATTENHTWVLAVLANDTEIGSQLRSKSQPEGYLQVMPLPYSLN